MDVLDFAGFRSRRLIIDRVSTGCGPLFVFQVELAYFHWRSSSVLFIIWTAIFLLLCLQFCIPPSNKTQSDKPRWMLTRCRCPSLSLGRPLLSPRRALRKNLPRKFKIMMDRIAVMMNTRMEWIKMSARPRASRTDWPSIRLIAARLSDCPMVWLSLSIKKKWPAICLQMWFWWFWSEGGWQEEENQVLMSCWVQHGVWNREEELYVEIK